MANPTLLTRPLCENADKNTIPATDAGTSGAFSEEYGWQNINSLPLASGGKAPNRRDFNGVFALLGGIAYACQRGYTFEWDATQDYVVGCVVFDTNDNKRYECISDVTANATPPNADTTHWHLQQFGLDREVIPAFNSRDVITTSGTYTAPVTGWYKITCIGGGGAGGNGGGVYNSGKGGLSGTQGGTTSFGGYCSASGGHSGGGGGASADGGGGGAGEVVSVYQHLNANDTIACTVGAGGVAPSSGWTTSLAGQNGSGGALGGSGNFIAGEGATNAYGYGAGGSGSNYYGGDSYYGAVPTSLGGENGTPYGGGGGGSLSYHCGPTPKYSARGGGNGQAGTTILVTDSTYPKGGDGGNGAIIIEYFANL